MSKNSMSGTQRGYSLTELLVAMAVFAVVFVAALLIYDRSNRSFKEGVVAADLQQSTRIAFDKLVADLRMTGFDYDRDGFPQDGEQQPDEQIEFAGPSAITIRGNFDYNTDAVNGHGRETAYEPAGDKFPLVTTANNEIVTFALKSTNAAANTASIQFYADVAIPRAAYTGGTAESLVTISGVDLTNNNPPYTLYRYTLRDDGTPDTPVPIAENIRSMKFYYYTDLAGSVLVTGAVQGAVGGGGQYDPASVGTTANFGDRDKRASVQSIKVELTGMSSDRDGQYTNTDTAVANYRTYKLETVIVPRNIGLSGTGEANLGPPGQPVVTSVCRGHCGAAIVTWSAPLGGSAVDKYWACTDTSSTGPFSQCVDANLNLFADFNNLTNGATYFFKVKAENEDGPTWSNNYITSVINNRTRPTAPQDLTATGGTNQISLAWTRPTANDTSNDTLSCIGSGGPTGPQPIPGYEPLYYKIWRGTNANFSTSNAAESELILDLSNRSFVTGSDPAKAFIDKKGNSLGLGPANCKPYYYRIQALDELCSAAANLNDPSGTGTATSATFPSGNPALGPVQGTSTAVPAAPIPVTIVSADSFCDVALNACTIKLSWPAVTTDSTGAPLAIDSYNITRVRKRNDGVSAYAPFSLPGSTPNVANALAMGSLVTYTDANDTSAIPPNPVPDHDTDGTQFVYGYRIRGLNCSASGTLSTLVEYPSCTFSIGASDVTQSGSLSGGSGMTTGDPWVFASGDNVTVTAPAGHTIARVVYTLTGDVTQVVTRTAAPFQYTWTDRTNDATYRLTISVTDTAGCVATAIRYITDQPVAGCFPSQFGATTVSPTNLGVAGDVGNDRFDTFTYNILNDNPFSQTLTVTGIRIVWTVPAAGSPYLDNPAIFLKTIRFGGTTSFTPNDTTGSVNQTVTGVTIPASNLTQYPIAIVYDYKKSNNHLTTSPITKICLTYTLASEPGVTKFCNIVPGQAAPNPTACQ